MAIDSRCIELAEYFLSDLSQHSEMDVTALAEEFQAIAEAFCSAVEEDVP